MMPNAFRSSVASQLSYNSITVDEERDKLHKSIDWEAMRSTQPQQQHGGSAASSSSSAQLYRRQSTDTVRSEEFQEGGRFGKLWSGRRDSDSESLRSYSQENSNWETETAEGNVNVQGWHVDIEEGTRAPLGEHNGLRGLDALRDLARGGGAAAGMLSAAAAEEARAKVEEQRRRDYQADQDGMGWNRQADGHKPQFVQTGPGVSRSHIFSVAGSLDWNSSVADGQEEEEDEEDDEAHWQRSGGLNRSGTVRRAEAGNRDSMATVRGVDVADGPSVNVWPPTPSGSIDGQQYSNGSSGDVALLRQAPRHAEPLMAQIDTASLYSVDSLSLEDDAQQTPTAAKSQVSVASYGSGGSDNSDDKFATPLQMPASVMQANDMPLYSASGPIGIAQALARPLNTPLVGPGARQPQLGPADASNGYSSRLAQQQQVYYNPNLPPGILPGSRRAKAIADHDGRESMVSDLDVETLRLDGSSRSSRRGSFSTLRSKSTNGGGATSQQLGQAAAMQAIDTSVMTDAQRFQQEWMTQEVRQIQQQQPQSIPHFLQRQQQQQQRHPNGVDSAASSPYTGSTSSTITARRSPGALAKRSQVGNDTKTGPTVAEDYLSQGITYHQQGDMSRSAFYFERSANVDGGCVVGMCMWGMALREGWGARKDPARGFEWIQKAAARAGEMSNTPRRSEADLKAIRVSCTI